MSATSPQFEVKITGDVSPERVPASVLGEFITLIEKAVLAVLGREKESQEELAFVSLVDVKQGSDWLYFSSPPTVIPAVGAITQAIAERQFDILPVKAHSYIYDANKLCNKHGWGIEFLPNEKYSIGGASIQQNELIPEPRKPTRTNGTTTIIGKVIRTGGVEPKVHIKLLDSEASLHIKVSEDQAKDLAGRLYEIVALDCRVSWLNDDWSMDTNTISVVEIANYAKPRSPSRAFARLSELSGETWDSFDVSRLSDTDKEELLN